MIRTRLFSTRFALALVLVLIMATSAFAFAAANDVPESGAGDGADTISGYTITNVKYTFNADPTKIETVAFDVASTTGDADAPSFVQARLVDGGTWISCTAGTSPNWSCPVAGAVTVLAANKLQVVAVQ